MKRRINSLINTINEEAGIDIFRNTRKRDYVEARALLTYLLRNYFGMRLSEIQRLFKTNGYPIHHATLLHALKNFKDTYLPYNPFLQGVYDKASTTLNNKTEFKIRHIQNRIQDIPEEKLDEVKQLIDELAV
jgi:hypothetical protein